MKKIDDDDETVIEYHPSKENYVNIREHCLHLWKPQNTAIPVPPKLFVQEAIMKHKYDIDMYLVLWT